MTNLFVDLGGMDLFAEIRRIRQDNPDFGVPRISKDLGVSRFVVARALQMMADGHTELVEVARVPCPQCGTNAGVSEGWIFEHRNGDGSVCPFGRSGVGDTTSVHAASAGLPSLGRRR